MALMAEGDLAAGQVELPHPAEAFVIEAGRPVPVLQKALPPAAQRFGIVQAQNLQVGDPEPGGFDRGQDLGQGRGIAAREDVALQPGVGRAGRIALGDAVDQGDAVVAQQLGELAEEHPIVGQADVLEHADRNDPVEAAALLPVVAKREADLSFQALALRPGLRVGQLLRRQSDAGHVCLPDFRQVEREPAPARADVQDLLPWLEQQLGGDMPLLGQLRPLQVRLRLGKVGAGVLPVPVQEEVVEGAGEVVVVGDVVPGPGRSVGLQEAPLRHSKPFLPAVEPASGSVAKVAGQDLEQVVDAAALDGQGSIHEGLAQAEPWIEKQAAVQSPIVEAHRDLRSGAWIAEAMHLAPGVAERQLARLDESTEESCEQQGPSPFLTFASAPRPGWPRGVNATFSFPVWAARPLVQRGVSANRSIN